MHFIGTGKVNATLFGLGDYPGAVKNNANQLTGDIFEIKDEKLLVDLDAYEGTEYNRKIQR